MFGRIGKVFLIALVSELGSAALGALRSRLERKLTAPVPAPQAQDVAEATDHG